MWRVSGFLPSYHSIQAHLFFQLLKCGWSQLHEYPAKCTAFTCLYGFWLLHPVFLDLKVALRLRLTELIYRLMCIHDVSKNENTAQNNLCSTANHDNLAVHLNNWIRERTVQCESFLLDFVPVLFRSCLDVYDLFIIFIIMRFKGRISTLIWECFQLKLSLCVSLIRTLTSELKSKKPGI